MLAGLGPTEARERLLNAAFQGRSDILVGRHLTEIEVGNPAHRRGLSTPKKERLLVPIEVIDLPAPLSFRGP